MVLMILKHLLDPRNNFLVGTSWLSCVIGTQPDGQLRKSCQTPHDDDVTSITLLLMALQDVLIDINDLFIVHDNWLSIGVLAGSVYEHFSELSNEPNSKLHKTDLVKIFLHSVVDFGDRILMKLWCGSNNCDDLGNIFFSSVGLSKSEHSNDGINMPLFVWRVFFTDLANLVGKLLLEFIIGSEKVVGQFLDDRLYVCVVGNLVKKIKGLFFDLHIMVFEAVSDRCFVSLNSVIVDINHLLELLKSNISYIVLTVHQEST
jgi:hypothetical protein